MSHSTKPINLLDQQFVHELSAYGLSTRKIAAIVEISQPSVVRILKKDIEDISESIQYADNIPMDNGCYQTVHYTSDWFPSVRYQNIGEHSDPTFDTVAAIEEYQDK